MSEAYGGLKDSKTQAKEHVDVGGVGAKRVLLSGYDGTNINDVNIDSNGALLMSNGMPIPEHDYMEIDASDSADVLFTYKTGGESGTSVATKRIQTVGTTYKFTLTVI